MLNGNDNPTTEIEVCFADNLSTVYIVGGANDLAFQAFVVFLRAAGLVPLPWPGVRKVLDSRQPVTPGLLADVFGGDVPIVVLLSADEEARPSRVLVSRDPRTGPGWEWAYQPHVDMLFLAGLVLGSAPERTALVRLGKLRGDAPLWLQSSIELDNSIRSRTLFLDRLAKLGCQVDRQGGWREAGDLEGFMKNPPAAAQP